MSVAAYRNDSIQSLLLSLNLLLWKAVVLKAIRLSVCLLTGSDFKALKVLEIDFGP